MAWEAGAIDGSSLLGREEPWVECAMMCSLTGMTYMEGRVGGAERCIKILQLRCNPTNNRGGVERGKVMQQNRRGREERRCGETHRTVQLGVQYK